MTKICQFPIAFETLRTYQGRPRALHLHLERLLSSCERIRYQVKCSTPQITDEKKRSLFERAKSLIDEALRPSKLRIEERIEESVVRCFLTVNLELSVKRNRLDHSYVNRSRSLVCVYAPLSYDPRAKHNSREEWDIILRDSVHDELLLCDLDGCPLESNNANFWSLQLKAPIEVIHQRLIKGGPQSMDGLVWSTPPLERALLPGITRALLLHHFKEEGAEVREMDFPHLKTKREQTHGDTYFYLSSTLKSLSWVKQIDQVPFQEPIFNQAIFRSVERYLSKC